ncbi:MAG: hypothetical protein ACR2RF_28835 [Geminicoccaceae bacterium]
MKAFITGVVAAIVIAIVAGLVLSCLPHDAGSAHQTTTGNVRLEAGGRAGGARGLDKKA